MPGKDRGPSGRSADDQLADLVALTADHECAGLRIGHAHTLQIEVLYGSVGHGVDVALLLLSIYSSCFIPLEADR